MTRGAREVETASQEFPRLTFDVWGSVPFPTKLTREALVQRILFCLRTGPKHDAQICGEVGASADEVQAGLAELARWFLVKKEGDSGWVADIPIFAKREVEIASEIGRRYAQAEAEILKNSIPGLRMAYEHCRAAKVFPWREAALVVVGALCADFCVSDRVPFRQEYLDEAFLPPLHPDGKRWGYVGREAMASPIPDRKYRFYQNLSRDSGGGISRFGYYGSFDEKRQSPPSRPERLRYCDAGKIWLSLAEGPLSLTAIHERTGIQAETVQAAVHEMCAWRPPGLVKTGDNGYLAGIPIFSSEELVTLLAEADHVAEMIHRDVSIPMQKELESTGKRLGLRFPLPSDASARDIALQLLSGAGTLPPIPQPPVPWSFGVWGWQGHLPMWEEVTTSIPPTPCPRPR
ncbi:MAG: hypothetical protein FJ279_06965 [Planctomycetes bacterium]|nr:hypothetical protein [Planctomycetota bacterium]MBM4078388.1 hypothetical protein [Planctomycetota bacterium]